jgi:hypothetical protein
MAVAVTTITDPDGTEWVLDGTNGYWEGQGRKGFDAPTYVHYRDESPAMPGAFWRGVRALPRELILPVIIRDGNRDLALSKRRAFTEALSPENGSGLCVIKVSHPDGSTRWIDARYVDGIDAGERGPGEYGITTMKYSLRFMADDPYFYGAQVVMPWQMAASTRTELPIPGSDDLFEVVSSPLLAGGVTINNPGGIKAYPTWEFVGPFTQIIAENETLGQSFTITHTAASSTDTLSLVTDPGDSYLVDELGANQWTTLSAGYQLWPLAPGDNIVNVTMTGATTDSLARLSYYPLYSGD